MQRIVSTAFLAYTGWWSFWFFAWWIVVHRFFPMLGATALDAAVSTAAMSIGAAIIANTFKYYRPGGSNYFYRALYIFAITLLVSIISNSTLDILFSLSRNQDYRAFVVASGPVRFGFIMLMMSFIGVLNWLLYYIAEQTSANARKEEAEKLMREAELTRLRQQLQPHFLFNSLNSISALAGSKPNEARKMVQQLSDFLRGTLRKDEYQMAALSEELAHIGLYLDIEKVRFGDRLHAEIVVSAPQPEELKVPALILQPILENTIKYGLYDTVGEVTIRMAASLADDGSLVVEVSNPFDPDSKTPAGTGFGLNYLERRLYLLFGRNDLLNTEKRDNLFITRLRIPQSKSSEPAQP